MKRASILYLLAFVLCPVAFASELMLPIGVYDYVANDGEGNVVASGKLHIKSFDAVDAGNWEITTTVAEVYVGPQNGTGELSLQVSGKEIYIDLNPGWDDNNIMLIGALEQGVLKGRWEWRTFVGVEKSGAFTAIRE